MTADTCTIPETSEVREPDQVGTCMVRVNEPPAIVCPPWCSESMETHRGDLNTWEGVCIHHGVVELKAAQLLLTATTLPDGTPHDGEPDISVVGRNGGGDPTLTLAEAESFAAELLEMVNSARMTTPANVTGLDPADVEVLTDLLDAMTNFASNEQRARYLLSSDWLRERGAVAAQRNAETLSNLIQAARA